MKIYKLPEDESRIIIIMKVSEMQENTNNQYNIHNQKNNTRMQSEVQQR